MPPEKLTLGQRLRAARTAAGLSQQQLAERAKITKYAISDLERDIRPARLETLYRLAVAIGCKPSDFDRRLTDRIGDPE